MEPRILFEHRRTIIPIVCFFFTLLYFALIASDPFMMHEILGLEPVYFPYLTFFRPFRVDLPFIGRVPLGDYGLMFPTDQLILMPLFIGLGIWYLIKERGLKLIAFLAACILAFKLLMATTQVLRILFDRQGSEGILVIMSFISLLIVGGAAFIVLLILKNTPTKVTTSAPSLWTRFVGYAIDLVLFVNIVLALRFESSGIIGRLLLLFLLVVFYFFFERIFFFTPGKILLNLRVQMVDGTVPDETAVMKRTFARLIPLEQLSFFNKSGGLHDTLSKTEVRKIEA
ncbi:RDD family protein [Pseudochryseolinea flava]|uniref:RDD domain-containing protein n=1 Tax=Pseudochryseolinea flava TaxID=2059302 RepID=A0A364Y274_9BACT|nr:RDD family protein [Pseudochryseolinea flava]RAW00870.1 hypothetical protein DQQ10_11550 [Pseudochryseolinea flava]